MFQFYCHSSVSVCWFGHINPAESIRSEAGRMMKVQMCLFSSRRRRYEAVTDRLNEWMSDWTAVVMVRLPLINSVAWSKAQQYFDMVATERRQSIPYSLIEFMDSCPGIYVFNRIERWITGQRWRCNNSMAIHPHQKIWSDGGGFVLFYGFSPPITVIAWAVSSQTNTHTTTPTHVQTNRVLCVARAGGGVATLFALFA